MEISLERLVFAFGITFTGELESLAILEIDRLEDGKLAESYKPFKLNFDFIVKLSAISYNSYIK